jgi:hypothetical protein
MKNLLLISTSYRIPDLIQVGFALGHRVKGFLLSEREKEINAICGYIQVGSYLKTDYGIK